MEVAARTTEPLVLVLDTAPDRRRRIAGFVRSAAVDVFELGELQLLRWYLERSSRRPQAIVIGLPVQEADGLLRLATDNPWLTILFVAGSVAERPPLTAESPLIFTIDGPRRGEALARTIRRLLSGEAKALTATRSA